MRPSEIDWPLIVADLGRAGLPRSKVALELNLPWSTVNNWRRGVEPSFAKGVALLQLHAKHCQPSPACSALLLRLQLAQQRLPG